MAWLDSVYGRARDGQERLWDKVLDWPLRRREVIAGIAAVLLLAGCSVLMMTANADFERDGDLARTQPRETAKFVEVIDGVRGEDTYYIELQGEQLEVDYGWFIPDPYPGAMVEVVRDPENPEHVLVAGKQDDWSIVPRLR